MTILERIIVPGAYVAMHIAVIVCLWIAWRRIQKGNFDRSAATWRFGAAFAALSLATLSYPFCLGIYVYSFTFRGPTREWMDTVSKWSLAMLPGMVAWIPAPAAPKGLRLSTLGGALFVALLWVGVVLSY